MREQLPDWLLSTGYAFRRAFLTRRRRYRLSPDGSGSFGLSTPARLPHRRVLLRPIGWPSWDALELVGRVWSFGSSVEWSISLEPQPRSGVLELELPYGLREFKARLLPTLAGARELELELEEVGAFAAAGALLRAGVPSLVRDLRTALGWSRGDLSQLPAALGVALAEKQDGVSYSRWRTAFQSPREADVARLMAAVRSTGLRVSVVTVAREDENEIGAQIPGRVDVVRSLAEARGDIVVPLRPGVRLVPHALATLAFLLQQHPDVAFLHADHDRLDQGRRVDPSFAPVLGPELVLSRNPFRGLVALRRSAFPDAPEPTLDPAGLFRWGLTCTSRVPGRVRRLPVVLATLDSDARGEDDAEREVIREHLRTAGTGADVQPGPVPGVHHVRYRLPHPAPTVAVVVPTRNAAALVETCVRSVRRLTRYPSYEILLVDNGSDEPKALASFEALARAGDVLLHRDPRPFNFSALNNAAVARTAADLVCLLNNDIEALHSDWLEEMVSVALQPGVGAVGAKLFYPDGRIQHGGVVVGLHGAADHAYAGAPGNAPGYAQQLLVRREVSAVTAACLVVQRSLYLEVGGLDEEAFSVSFNDVDFCLKLGERGYRNVWTPHARLVHHESASRGRSRRPEPNSRAERELAALRSRWARALVDDPYQSPNLSLSSKVPRLAWPPRERRPWSV